MSRNEYVVRLERAFESVFKPKPPMTDAEVREQARLVARQRERDEARRHEPEQPALPLG